MKTKRITARVKVHIVVVLSKRVFRFHFMSFRLFLCKIYPHALISYSPNSDLGISKRFVFVGRSEKYERNEYWGKASLSVVTLLVRCYYSAVKSYIFLWRKLSTKVQKLALMFSSSLAFLFLGFSFFSFFFCLFNFLISLSILHHCECDDDDGCGTGCCIIMLENMEEKKPTEIQMEVISLCFCFVFLFKLKLIFISFALVVIFIALFKNRIKRRI